MLNTSFVLRMSVVANSDCKLSGWFCRLVFGWFCRLAVGTAFGYLLFDYQQNQSVYSKCTLSATGKTLHWGWVRICTGVGQDFALGEPEASIPSKPMMHIAYSLISKKF